MTRLRTLAAFVVAGMTTGLIWTGVAVAAPGSCADVMPLAAVVNGDIGEGWTVVSGTDPQSFDAEVLGVMPDLIEPGRDVIIVEISGPTVDAGGGVWAGMSGSPVYIDHGGGPELAGALAYGFSFGATNIRRPDACRGHAACERARRSRRGPQRGSPRESSFHARSCGKSRQRSARLFRPLVGDLIRLKLPMSISGVAPERYRAMRKLPSLKKYRPMMKFTQGAAAPSASLSGVVDDLAPGGNFAAALSYGDLTSAGVGTTTYVCDGQALAFGHPMLFSGRTSLGAGSADAITIVTTRSAPTSSPTSRAPSARSTRTSSRGPRGGR